LNIIQQDYFKELREQIIDTNKWDKEHFVVFDHEAGTGKSREARRILGEMTKTHDHRVLYVQLFERNQELDNTVRAINEHAGRIVAERFAKDDIKSRKKREQAIEAQILCITHRMYKQICSGTHRDLLEGRGILIIDEYPDLLEKITVSREDIMHLWADYCDYRHKEIEDLAYILRDKLNEYEKKYYAIQHKKMIPLSFESEKYDKYKKAIRQLLKIRMDKEKRELLRKFQQILENGALFFEKKFHTYDASYDFVLLDNNIILDANANFDYRYRLSDKFILKNQGKVYDYAHSVFYQYNVNTSKKGLSKYLNFMQTVLGEISIEGRKGILFVTDKDNKENVEKSIEYYFASYGDNLSEIEERLNCKIAVDYFGNLVGVNTYKDFDTVVILKTPFFDYLTYSLTYFYFQKKLPSGNIEIFKDEKVENIRKNTIAGEIYQAIKRISRDNSHSSKMYVFCDNQDIVDIVLQQFPNIQYVKREIYVAKKREEQDNPKRKETLYEQKIAKLRELLLEYKEAGVPSVRKKELREKLGIKDKSNFAKMLRSQHSFLQTHYIVNKGQKLIFK
jgi:hypothetical protein